MQGTTGHGFSFEAFNRATVDQATAMMDRIVERSAWLARRTAEARPFADAEDLATWIDTEVRSLTKDEAIQLLCAHPELSPPDPSLMTLASQTEQGRLNFLTLDRDTAAALSDLNRRYTRRHGYPFVIALHEHADIAGVFDQFEERISADPDKELVRALGQVVSVMKARLVRLTQTGLSSDIPERETAARADAGGRSR